MVQDSSLRELLVLRCQKGTRLWELPKGLFGLVRPSWKFAAKVEKVAGNTPLVAAHGHKSIIQIVRATRSMATMPKLEEIFKQSPRFLTFLVALDEDVNVGEHQKKERSRSVET